MASPVCFVTLPVACLPSPPSPSSCTRAPPPWFSLPSLFPPMPTQSVTSFKDKSVTLSYAMPMSAPEPRTASYRSATGKELKSTPPPRVSMHLQGTREPCMVANRWRRILSPGAGVLMTTLPVGMNEWNLGYSSYYYPCIMNLLIYP